jgi:homogentisate 1,2-dioxygenase
MTVISQGNPMPQYRKEGKIPHKRHTQLRDENGKLAYEEMVTFQGFEDIYSLLYHASPPAEAEVSGPLEPFPMEVWERKEFRHHLLDTMAGRTEGGYFETRRTLLFNEDVTVSVASPSRKDGFLFRNALCDELVCVGRGEGELHSPFGVLSYGPGDLIVIPRGVTQEWCPKAGSDSSLLVMESTTTITPPARYLNRLGQFTFHSPVCERDVRTPVLPAPRLESGRFQVRVKLGSKTADHYCLNHPFDVSGWDGYLYPYAINMEDFEPLTRRIHTMPDDQQIFEAAGVAVCCLVPRLLDYHPDAIPAPPYHSSVDIDEVIFNMGESFMGWTRPAMGVTTFHPRGIVHGPKPGGYEGSIGMKDFDGTAIMIDTLKPLVLTQDAERCDDPSYKDVWTVKETAGASWEGGNS